MMPDTATLLLSCSFHSYIPFHQLLHCVLKPHHVIFCMQQHYSLHPVQSPSTHPFVPQSCSQKRKSTGAPLSSQYTASHWNQPTFATCPLSQQPQITLSLYDLQKMLRTQCQSNGYLFNLVIYPSSHFRLLLFQMQWELKNWGFSTTGEARRVHQISEVCEGQY